MQGQVGVVKVHSVYAVRLHFGAYLSLDSVLLGLHH